MVVTKVIFTSFKTIAYLYFKPDVLKIAIIKTIMVVKTIVPSNT